MNLWFRLIATLISALWKPSLTAPLDRSHLRFRVWPNDLDLNFHMNNGRYFTIMDLGRADLLIRMKMVRPMFQRGWMPVLTSSVMRFRRELRLFEPFDLETAIVYWHGSTFVMEQRLRFVKGRRAGAIAATALLRGGIYDRKERSFVSFAHMAEVFGFTLVDSPPASDAVNALLTSEDAIRQSDREDAGQSQSG